jgi:hypothetical protein
MKLRNVAIKGEKRKKSKKQRVKNEEEDGVNDTANFIITDFREKEPES